MLAKTMTICKLPAVHYKPYCRVPVFDYLKVGMIKVGMNAYYNIRLVTPERFDELFFPK
jgi:hypothetical protein